MSDALTVLMEMPRPQQLELVRLSMRHPDSSWHLADCGCCVCLHMPSGSTHEGWLIGADGVSEYHREVKP